jgi:hypothetical protein
LAIKNHGNHWGILKGMMKLLKTFCLYIFLWGQAFCTAQVTLTLPDLELQDDGKGNKISTTYLGEDFQVVVEVVGGDRNPSKDPDIVGANNFNNHGKSVSSSVSIINGFASSSSTYSYEFSSNQKGVFTLGPAEVIKNGTRLTSNSINVQVLGQENRKSVPQEKQHRNYNQSDAAGTTPQEVHVLAKLLASKQKVFVGESVDLAVRIYSRGPVIQLGIDQLTSEGFVVKEKGTSQVVQRELNGVVYDVIERYFTLTPLTTGQKIVPGIGIVYTARQPRTRKKNSMGGFFGFGMFDDFFDRSPVVQKRTKSNDLVIDIQPLPIHDKKINGIGKFVSFDAFIDKDRVVTNEPLVLKLEVQGNGNFDQMVDPELKLPSGIQSYKSKAHYQNIKGEGKKIFEYVVQCGKEGEIVLPEQEFTFFDIEKQNYSTLKTKSLMVMVEGGSNINQLSAPQRSDEKEKNDESGSEETKVVRSSSEQDIHFIMEEEGSVPVIPLKPVLFLLCVVVIISLFFGADAKRFFLNKKLLSMLQFSKNKEEVFKRELKLIVDNKRAEKLYEFFLSYVAFKLEEEKNGINQHKIERWLLRKKKWNNKKVDGFINYLNDCVSISFATNENTQEEKLKLLKDASYWLILL